MQLKEFVRLAAANPHLKIQHRGKGLLLKLDNISMSATFDRSDLVYFVANRGEKFMFDWAPGAPETELERVRDALRGMVYCTESGMYRVPVFGMSKDDKRVLKQAAKARGMRFNDFINESLETVLTSLLHSIDNPSEEPTATVTDASAPSLVKEISRSDIEVLENLAQTIYQRYVDHEPFDADQFGNHMCGLLAQIDFLKKNRQLQPGT